MKLKKILFFAFLIFVFVSCSNKENNFSELIPEDSSKKVSAEIKEFKNDIITYELKNHKDLSYTFSDFYIVYRLNKNKWEELLMNQNIKSNLFKLKPSEYKEITLQLPNNFSKNFKGIFRIRKPFVYDEKNEMENVDMIFEIK
ncbi:MULTISPECIES: immunoglobulin-like domain-containing protein [Helcococcus]|uniref:Immunoglobulin-like domain-containing protein n=1 Tax=Helcococcus bovis TaxID=3153252 RepID=A0ABW9F5S4_9FIRM